MKSTLLLAASCFFASVSTAAVDYQGNLSRIPATDPKATDTPALLPAVRGVHPRLLFTPSQISALKAKIAASPLLKQVADQVIADARRFRLPEANPLAVVTGDTQALVQANGHWPALAYAHALAPDDKTLAAITQVLERMLDQPYWADTAELDSNMGAGCNLYAVALLYDAAWKDLPADLRDRVAERLLVQARRMFYLGHKQLGLTRLKYRQQDPGNNHRWYRLRGLAAALLAIADHPKLETGHLLAEFKKEMDFIMKWFPKDGDCHEGAGYQVFGFRSLLEAAIMADNALGTSYLRAPGFANAWAQQLYFWVPADNSGVSFGDAQNGPAMFRYDDAAFFISPALNRSADIQAALLRRYERMAKHPDPKRSYTPPWSLLAYLDPTVKTGDYRAVPTNRLFADIGAASFRDSWEDDGVILTFRCGPYGGQALNAYRHAHADKNGHPHYINVAHNDPDANGFSLNVAGEHVFHPGLYATTKITRDNNTVTVGDKGQINENSAWVQPVPRTDMRTLSYLTAWKADASGNAIIEGETGPAYQGMLDRFRRTVVWLPRAYILVLDDIRPAASAKEPLVWRGTVPDGRVVNPERGLAEVVAKSGKKVPFQLLADSPVSAAVKDWKLLGRWGNADLHQFQFSVQPAASRLATLIDPWNRAVTMAYSKTGDTITLVVKTPAGSDIWTWNPASGAKIPSSISATRSGRPLIALTAADTPPAH